MNKQIRKRLVRFYNVFDADGDGYITQVDAERSLGNLAALRGYKKGSPDYESFRAAYLIYWNDLLEATDLDQNSEITEEEWLQYHEELLTNKSKAMQTILPSVFALFDVMDADGNGSISMTEYRNFMHAFGVPDKWIGDEVFQKLDINKDGSISKKEMGEVVDQMYFNPDPSCPGNYLFGIL
ncbi:MAG: EF-hand domain-containing protein [Ignavibacteriae bacterium]|nr:MAG: EF-hand domain-containing protein [Ignavibacteriota bacterium]